MREELKKIDIKGMTKIVVIAIILYWTLNNLGIIWSLISKILIIFSPFILGACLAFILNIPMNFFEKNISKIKNKKGKRRFSQKFTKVISLCLAIILIIIIFVLIIKLIVPELLSVLGMLIENIPLYADEVYEILKNSTKDMPDINQIIEKTNINLEELKQQAVGIITNILTSSIAFIGNIISAVTNFVIAIIFAVYILAGKHKLKEQAQKLLYAYIKREKAILDGILSQGFGSPRPGWMIENDAMDGEIPV
ncbi:MAG: AI-2E family transporter, partial [Clostridia bacterium]|nr:AI-2E family transporter [Clostridia bacterium]